MTCIDLGANAGYFTLLMARVVGKAGRVYAFEPTRTTYALLRNNLGLNRVANVVAEELAVGEFCGEIAFHEGPPGYDVYNTVGRPMPKLDAIASEFTIRNVGVTTLDQYCIARSILSVNFIKLDIEGGEWAALRGAEQVIASNPSLSMVIECAPELAAACDYRLEDMLSWLAERGFGLYRLHSSGRLSVITDFSSVNDMLVAVRPPELVALAGFSSKVDPRRDG